MVDNFTNELTWWAAQCLSNIEQFEDKKLILRGLTYAQNKAVQQVFLNKDFLLEGKVLGMGISSYTQAIKATVWDLETQQNIFNFLLSKPNYIAQLLAGQLPKDLVRFLSKEQLSLLMEDWQEWERSCSCSTSGVLCKHLLAVLMVFVTQLDANPLLFFKLRGMDLEVFLREKGYLLKGVSSGAILNLTDYLKAIYTQKETNLAALPTLDFSTIKNDWKRYFKLLEDKTSFATFDLKTLLYRNTKKAFSTYQKQIFEQDNYALLHQKLKKTKDIALILDALGQPINLVAIYKENNEALLASDRVITDCIALLETVEEGKLPLYSDAFIALHTVYRFALKSLKEQNFLPRLMATTEGYFIQWIPAYNMNKEVALLLDKLVDLCPSDLLLLDDNGLKIFEPKEQVLVLCHLFISHFLQLAREVVLDDNNQVEYCFFSGMPTKFELANQQGFPSLIQAWLQPFYLGNRSYAPVLKILESKEEEQAEFYIKILVENKQNLALEPIDLAAFLKQKKYKKQHLVVLQELYQLVRYFPDLESLIEEPEQASKAYSGAAFEELFFEILPVIKLLQIAVLLPKSLQQLTKPKLGWSISKKKENSPNGKSFLNIKSLLNLNWKIALGEEMLEVLEFLKLIKGKEGLIKHKEQYIHLDKEDLEHIFEQLQQPLEATANQVVQAALCPSFNGIPVEVSTEVFELMQELRANPIVDLPLTLKANLRPYQHVGYSWMYKNSQLGLGSLIADDMGLGKTLQVISLLLKFKEEGCFETQQALIIVPTSLMTNWMSELQKFAPLLSAKTYHGAKRKLSQDVDILITTYGVARLDLKLLNQLNLYCTIIDEAQNIKNVSTVQTEAVKSINATLHIAMSGTPVENRLAEYWSIMDYVNPNYLGTYAAFTEDYCIPIEKENNQQCLETFRQITAPFLLRRLKSDKSIIQDLPDKIEQNCIALLQQEQAEIYQKIVDDTLHDLSKFKDDKKKRQGLILKLMGGLKQVCNHPYQYLRTGRQGPECSGKSQLLMDLLVRIEEAQEKVLIFTQYRKMGNLMVQWLTERFGQEPMYLHGGTPRPQRDEMVRAFQQDKQQRVFILSLKAAGTGLNLTAANHVIHYDLWWNPAVEAQATDRAYRIGQQKNVQVYRFITEGTLEEKIDAMIQSKKELADMAVAIGEKWLGDLADEELRLLVSRKDR